MTSHISLEIGIRSWIKDRTIGSVKIGRLRRIPADDLDKLMTRLPSLQEVTEEALAK